MISAIKFSFTLAILTIALFSTPNAAIADAYCGCELGEDGDGAIRDRISSWTGDRDDQRSIYGYSIVAGRGDHACPKTCPSPSTCQYSEGNVIKQWTLGSNGWEWHTKEYSISTVTVDCSTGRQISHVPYIPTQVVPHEDPFIGVIVSPGGGISHVTPPGPLHGFGAWPGVIDQLEDIGNPVNPF